MKTHLNAENCTKMGLFCKYVWALTRKVNELLLTVPCSKKNKQIHQ